MRQAYRGYDHEEIPFEDRFGMFSNTLVDPDFDREDDEVVSTYRSKKNEGAE